MLVDAQIWIMIAASLIAAVPKSMWRGTAIFMLLVGLFNLGADPFLDYRSSDNPYVLAIINFVAGSMLLVWGSKHRSVFPLTLAMAWIFFLGMFVEIMHLHDINTDTFMVYTNYPWIILVLNLTQFALLFGGMHYGRLRTEDTDSRRSGHSTPVLAD